MTNVSHVGVYRCRHLLLTLSLTALAGADVPPAEYGPRVTLPDRPISIQEAAEQIGRQINRRLYGAELRERDVATRTIRLPLRDATARCALDGFEAATGLTLRRQSRFYYAVGRQDYGYRRVGVPLGDWVAWLNYVRYYFYSYLYFTDPPYRGSAARLYTHLSLDAPSDAESCRVVAVGNLRAVTRGDEEILDGQRQGDVRQPDGQDPASWVLTQSVEAPGPDVAELAELSFEVRFCERLDELVYTFDHLPATTPRLQTVGDYDATLSAGDGGPNIGLEGPAPEWFQPTRSSGPAESERWIEARLFAGEKPLYTQWNATSSTVDNGIWRATWTIRPTAPDQRERPDRLVLRLYVPHGEGSSERIAFHGVPIPNRDPEAPFRP